MKKVLKVLGVTAAATVGAGLYFTNKLMYMKKKTEEEIERKEGQSDLFDKEVFESLRKEEIHIPSPYGYKLHGYFIPSEGSTKYMVFCHGVTTSYLNSVKYCLYFLKKGYNVIIYDHRRHGKSGGKTTSFGYYEKYDLKAVVDWVRKRFGDNMTLGIHGESMGACTLLQYAGYVEDGADFYIADCPFSDFQEQLIYRLKEDYKLPKWPLIPLANLFLRMRDGYRVEEVSPIEVIDKVKSPILFIHSVDDMYIPVHMTEELYEKKQGDKQLLLAPNGGHALSYPENIEAYEEAVDTFLTTYVDKK
ncbi:alpha/beta hydrolase [Priestia taiwanensis]|uniref:Alpha/beta hydrolase n=1 Tax=Priestia taiwanensis TaxID=1347902 RepID=A0A917AU44_9BACI|nr:alpha/beta hydrolase [Priestia taiwanensis]MBM7363965.1 fermentation-respiration switch protein FrsA (DUF1100 family) [Priestia taiwanensis]GGE70554.1 alpha/beta hydrolase [Priestia taiwanensis]